MSKFTSLIKKLYYDKRVRFLFVGGLNTIVGVGCTLIVYLCFGLPLFSKESIPMVPMIVGTLTGQVIGTIHSYFWNKYFTFRSNDKSKKEFLRFLLVYVVQYLVSFGLTKLFDMWITIPGVVTIVTTFVSMIISYVGHNLFSFKQQNTGAKTEAEDSTSEEIEGETQENGTQDGVVDSQVETESVIDETTNTSDNNDTL